jgi:hypothetical protein
LKGLEMKNDYPLLYSVLKINAVVWIGAVSMMISFALFPDWMADHGPWFIENILPFIIFGGMILAVISFFYRLFKGIRCYLTRRSKEIECRF